MAIFNSYFDITRGYLLRRFPVAMMTRSGIHPISRSSSHPSQFLSVTFGYGKASLFIAMLPFSIALPIFFHFPYFSIVIHSYGKNLQGCAIVFPSIAMLPEKIPHPSRFLPWLPIPSHSSWKPKRRGWRGSCFFKIYLFCL